MDDLQLARALARNDSDAARILTERYFDRLFRFIRQLIGRADDAEDLAIQTLARVLRNAARYDGRAPMSSWVFSFALREVGRWRRNRLWVRLPPDAQTPGDLAARTADAQLLIGALRRLSEAHRATFLLHYVEGLSIEEIALAQGAKSGTVKSRLHFARARLKELLEQEEFYVTQTC